MNQRVGIVAAVVGTAALIAIATWRLAGGPAAPERAVPEGSPPHVVVVIGCTLRADQLSPYGGEPAVAPFIDGMAAQGATFARTLAQAPWTRPAVAALITGMHPTSTGIVEPGPTRNDRRLPAEVTTLAEHFRAAGYATIGLTGNSNLNPVFGFDQGFDAYRATDKLWRQGLEKVDGSALVTEALKLLDAAPADAPVYLQLVMVDTHKPVAVTDAEVEPFKVEGVPARLAQYRAMVHRLDQAVAALDEGLRQRGMDETNTILVVAADHGEGLRVPEHHGNGHGNYLYTSSVHVPLILRGPGVGPGVKVEGLSAQVDLAPTLLGLAGVPGGGFEGQDHAALLAAGGKTARAEVYTDTWFREVRRAAIYGEKRMCQVDLDPEGTAAMVARTKKKKKRKPTFPEACFRWTDDAAFEYPITDAEGVQRVRDEFEVRAAQLAQIAVEEADLDQQTVDQLKALGYDE